MSLHAQHTPHRQGRVIQSLDKQLVGIRASLSPLFNELSKFKPPPENPSGYRQIDGRAVAYTQYAMEDLKKHPLVRIVERFDASREEVYCASEDGRLQVVVMSPPTFLDWKKGINEQEKKYLLHKPDRLVATDQFLSLVLANLNHGVEVVIILPDPQRKEGTFTRDIAFAVMQHLFLANMESDVRKPEEETVVGWIKPPKEAIIEGGNVILGNGVVFVGVGDRTNTEAVEWLKTTFSALGISLEVIPLRLKKGILHLDCAFCPIEERDGSPGLAIIRPQAFSREKDIALLKKMYGQMKLVSKGEFYGLGANVLKLDKSTYIFNPKTPSVAKTILRLGIDGIPVDYHEINKGEGLYRCTELSTKRKN